MRRDYEDEVFDTGFDLNADEYLEQASQDPASVQNVDTLRPGYPWIQHFLREHPGYEFVEYSSPPAMVQVPDLMEARVALISTTGVHVEDQKPFNISPGEVDPEYLNQRFREMGDITFRVISAPVESSRLRIAYPYLDTAGAEEDINTVFPIDRLMELEEENYIASIAGVHLSFMGYLPDPTKLKATAESAVQLLLQDDVNLALLIPADILSHQTMAILQRDAEDAGIATISVALCRDVVERIGVPRAVHYRFPFGYTFGDPNDAATQLRILKETLRSGSEIRECGAIVDLPYEWIKL